MEIGKYNRNSLRGDAWWFVDQFGFLRMDDEGDQGDAIGANYIAYCTYGDDLFVRAVEAQWGFEDYKWMVGQRHPTNDNKMSRDHYIYTLALFKKYFRNGGSGEAIVRKNRLIIECTPSRLRKIMPIGKGLVNWAKALLGDSEAEKKYLKSALRLGRFYIVMNWIGNTLGRFTEEVTQDEWKKVILQDQSRWKKLMHGIMYPAYALSLTCVKLDSLDDAHPELKARVKATYLKLASKTNYMHQLLLGGEVDASYVQAYKPMQGGRWTGYLNERNDRDMKVLPDREPVNQLDWDYIRRLYVNSI